MATVINLWSATVNQDSGDCYVKAVGLTFIFIEKIM